MYVPDNVVRTMKEHYQLSDELTHQVTDILMAPHKHKDRKAGKKYDNTTRKKLRSSLFYLVLFVGLFIADEQKHVQHGITDGEDMSERDLKNHYNNFRKSPCSALAQLAQNI